MYEWKNIVNENPPHLKECFVMTATGHILVGIKPDWGNWFFSVPVVSGPDSISDSTDDIPAMWALMPDPNEMTNITEKLPTKDGMYVIWSKLDSEDIPPYNIAEFKTSEGKFFLNNGEPKNSDDYFEWEAEIASKWADLPSPLSWEEIREFLSETLT